MSPPRKIVVHYHIFKNAGTSIERSLEAHFGNSLFRFETERPDGHLRPDDAGRLIEANPALRAISSHQLHPPIPEGPFEIFPVVAIREPIRRVRSAYLFEWQKQPGLVTPKGSFRDYVEWRLANPRPGVVADFQVTHLSRCVLEDRDHDWTDLEAGFEVAVEFLSSLPGFGLVERFEQSVQVLNRELSAFYGHPIEMLQFRRDNVTQDPAISLDHSHELIRGELGDELFEELLERNRFDRRLYEWAVEAFERRWGRPASSIEPPIAGTGTGGNGRAELVGASVAVGVTNPAHETVQPRRTRQPMANTVDIEDALWLHIDTDLPADRLRAELARFEPWGHKITFSSGVSTAEFERRIPFNQTSIQKLRVVEREVDLEPYRGGRVLDIGSNSGHNSIRLATTLDMRATGVDVTERHIEVASMLAKISGAEARFLLADAETYCEPDSFDIVLHFGTLYHLPNPLQALATSFANLRPGGLLALETQLYDHPDDENLCYFMNMHNNDASNFWALSTSVVSRCLTMVGFVDVAEHFRVQPASLAPGMSRVIMTARKQPEARRPA